MKIYANKKEIEFFDIDIYIHDTNIILNKINNDDLTNFSIFLNEEGEYKFDVYSKKTKEMFQIKQIVKVYNNYTSLFQFEKELTDCNYYNLQFNLTNIGIENKSISLINILLNNELYGMLPYKNNKRSFLLSKTVGNYSLIITEKNDINNFLYKKDFKLTDINLPQYQFYPNYTIVFSDLYCDISKSSFTNIMLEYRNKGITIEEKEVNCINGIYNNNLNTLNCTMENSIYSTFGIHYLTINKFPIDKSIFLSNNIKNIKFEFENKNSIYVIKDPNKSFYMDKIEKIKVLLDNKIEYYTHDNFTINEYEIILNTEEYEVNIIYIKIEQEEWETDTSNEDLYNKIDNEIFNEYLYSLNTKFCLLDYDNKKNCIIILEFEDYNNSKKYKDSFNNLKCEDPNDKYLSCSINNKELNESGEFQITINNYSSKINKIKYGSYQIEGEKCQTIYNNSTDIIISIDFIEDCSIELYYKNNLIENAIKMGIIKNNELLNIGNTTNFIIKPNNNIKDDIFKFILKCKNEEPFSYEFHTGIKFYNYIIDSANFEISFVENENIILFLNLILNSNRLNTIYLQKETSIYYAKHIYYPPIYKFYRIDFYIIIKKNEKYELFYKDKCSKSIPTGIIISCIEFKIKRKYYVINNNFNNTYYKGYIENGKESLILYNYILGEEKEELNEIGNGIYEFTINKIGKNYFSFKNYLNEAQEHRIEDYVNIYENYTDFLYFDNQIPSSYYIFNNKKFDYEFKLNTNIIDISIDNLKLVLFDPNIDNCNNNLCFYNFTSLLNGKFKLDTNFQEKLTSGNDYKLLIIEGDDLYTPIYSFNISLIDIKLTSPNLICIYNNAPYINFYIYKSSSKLDLNLNLTFDNGNEKKNINCTEQSLYNETNNIYRCYLPNDFINFEAGNYQLFINDVLITERIFISKSIEEADFKINIPEKLYVGINTFEVSSDNFLIQEISVYSNIDYNNPSTQKRLSGKVLLFGDYKRSKIILSFELEENTKVYIYKIERSKLEYDNDSSVTYQIISNEQSSILLEVNVFELNFIFDKIYIILNSGIEFNYNSSFKEINISPINNSHNSSLENLDYIYLKSINNTLILDTKLDKIENKF